MTTVVSRGLSFYLGQAWGNFARRAGAGAPVSGSRYTMTYCGIPHSDIAITPAPYALFSGAKPALGRNDGWAVRVTARRYSAYSIVRCLALRYDVMWYTI